ncbi:hypothetical protein V6Z11_A02G113700 [Gossypium hirsutum]
MEIQRTFSTIKAIYNELWCLCVQTIQSFSTIIFTETGTPSTQILELCLLLPSIAKVWAALLTSRGTKRESLSTTKHRKPILKAKSKALSHALASATNASTTSSNR